MEEQNPTLKKGSSGWIVAGFVFAVLGGFLGIIIGLNYALGKYEQETKNTGWIIVAVAVVAIFFYVARG